MTKENTQIVISGAGLVTPLGLSLETTWESVRAGRCGLGPLAAMEQPLAPGSTGGQAPDLPADFEPGQPREVRYLRRAIADALRNSGIDPGRYYPGERCGFIIGTTLHGMRAAGQFLRNGTPGSLSRFLAGATLRDATVGIPFTGFAATACSACSSSLGSIALGVTLLRSGRLDLVVAGGYDTISEYVYAGFNSLRLVAPGPLRPFTRDRQGMKLAEGYGIVVLERAADAARRGAAPLATILGYGESADAHHLTQPHPQGEGAARAMTAALASAGLTPADIDMIAAHATGTPDNDAGEFAALSRVLGADLPRVPVVAFKSHLGHTLGGAGAVELILSALSLRDQIQPACVNVREEDLEFPGLRVALGSARPAALRTTMNTSLGFGGANTCMVLGKAPEADSVQTEQRPHNAPVPAAHASPSATSDVFITGIGIVLPGMVGNEAFARAITAAEPRRIIHDTGAIAEADYIDLLNARRVRRMSDYVKLSLAATILACRDAGITDIPAFAANCSALLGSTHCSTNYSEAYYEQIVREGIGAANPMLFAEGVPNAAAAHLSLMLALKGPCQTVIGTRTAGLDALHLASLRIAAGEWDRAIVGAAEEFSPVVNGAYRHWGLHTESDPAAPFSGSARRGMGSPTVSSTRNTTGGPPVPRGAGAFVAGCGAVTLVLESGKSLSERRANPRGQILNTTGPLPIARRGAALTHGALRLLGDAHHILSSANGTWLDRLETSAVCRRPGRFISSLSGYVAETHSVMPLAGIAAVLLTRQLPRLLGRNWPPDVPVLASSDTISQFAVLCSDYTGILSAAKVGIC